MTQKKTPAAEPARTLEVKPGVDEPALEYRPEAGEKAAKEGAAQVAHDPSPDDQPAGEK